MRAALAIAFLAAGAATAMAAVTPSAGASPLDEKREKARVLVGQLSELDREIDAAAERFGTANRQLDKVRADLRQSRREHQQSEQRLAAARRVLTTHAVSIYKRRDISSIDVLLGARSFGDLVSEVTMLSHVAKNNNDIVGDVAREEKQLREISAKLSREERQAQQLVEQRQREEATLRGDIAQRQALLSGVQADIRRMVAAQERAAARRAAAAAQARVAASSSSSAANGPSASPSSPGSDPAPSGGWSSLINQAASANGISAAGLYRLMMLESSGSASVVSSAGYVGLFQYHPATWRGSWNPYRSRPITDGGAQIAATALAIRQGRGPSWWPNTYPLAFSGR